VAVRQAYSAFAATVEDLDVGVYDALPGRPDVDGLPAPISCITSGSPSTGKICGSSSSRKNRRR
jgi:hypothetical protein